MKEFLWNGIKGGLYALIAVILTLIVESLTLAMGYKPEGIMNQAVWLYAVLPAMTALVRFLKEYLKDKMTKKVG